MQIIAKEDKILITSVVNVPPINEWEKLFEEAKKKGFDPVKDVKEFADWNVTLNDGDEKL